MIAGAWWSINSRLANAFRRFACHQPAAKQADNSEPGGMEEPVDDPDELQRRYQAEVKAVEMADFLRDVVRAVAAAENPNYYRVAQRFAVLMREFPKCEQPDLYQLCRAAIDDLRPPRPDPWDDRNAIDGAIVTVVGNGMQYLTEITADDPGSRGRGSRRRSEFLDSIRLIELAREAESRHFRSLIGKDGVQARDNCHARARKIVDDIYDRLDRPAKTKKKPKRT